MIGGARSRPPGDTRGRARELARRFFSRWVVGALVAEGVLALLGAVFHHAAILTTSYLLPVLAGAVVETGERTAVLAVVAAVLAAVSGVWNGDIGSGPHLYRLVIVTGGGTLSALGATFRSRAQRARDRMEMLAAIAEIADGGSALEDALARLADILVPGAADASSLVLFDADGPRRVLVRAVNPELAARLEVAPAPPRQALETARTGETMLVQRAPSRGRRSSVRVSEEARVIMEQTGLASVIYAPMRVADRTLALLLVGVGPSGRRYGVEDVRFVRTVASRAALAIDNARLMTELRSVRQRLEATVGSLADAVTIREVSGRLIYANDAAKSTMGMALEHDIAQDDPVDLFDRYIVSDEHGRPLTVADLPSVRLLAGEEASPLVLRFVSRDRGEEQWRILKSSPLYDPQGRVEAAVTVIEDITESKRAELRSTFLSRASEILSSSLDYEQTLRNVAELAVPDFADWCAVDLIDEEGKRHQVVAAHRDPDKVALAERLRDMGRAELDPDVGLGAMLRSGRSQLIADIDEALLRRRSRSDEHLARLLELGMRSAVIVPMIGPTGVVGAMTLVNAESGRRFTPDDVGFAEQIASRAAVAVDNARLYTERARIAATLQRSLLPDALPAIDGWEIASLYRPALGEAVEVGGDFYDAFAVHDGWIVLIGDVTGKGVEAAAMTSLVRHGARFVADYVRGPAQILERLDRSLREQREVSLCTALCLLLEEGGRLTVASGGHPLPVVVGADGVRTVGQPGDVLGAFPDARWPTREVTLDRHEVLVLYTDGVTDTVGAEGRFGEEQLHETLARCGPTAPGPMLSCLDAALSEFQVGSQVDDTAVVALRRTG